MIALKILFVIFVLVAWFVLLQFSSRSKRIDGIYVSWSRGMETDLKKRCNINLENEITAAIENIFTKEHKPVEKPVEKPQKNWRENMNWKEI